MADVFDPLRTLEELSAPPLSAGEVRRRGDQRRRRRSLVQVGMVTVAVFGIAATFTLVAGGPGNGDLSPAPAPTHTTPTGPAPAPSVPTGTAGAATPAQGWLQRVPRGFALAQGLPDDSGSDSSLEGPSSNVAAFDGTVCDLPVVSRDAAVDSLAATYQAPEDSRARLLLVFRDPAAAQAELTRIEDVFSRCPVDGGARHRLSPLTRRDAGWWVLTTYVADGLPSLGQETLVVNRVGNALLLASEYGEGPGATDREAADQIDREARNRMLPLLSDLCIFALDPCTQ